MSAQDLEQRARELLAEAFSDAGAFSAADTLLRTAYVTDYKTVVAHRAIVAALRQQPAPVDLEQFREAICSWREDSLRKSETYVTYTSRTVMAKRVTEADRLLSIIDNAGKVASAEPVAYIYQERYGHKDEAWIERIERALPVWEHRNIIPLYAAPHQPAPVVDDARMARALEAARCGLAPEHVSAIEEAIAAYDPNCGARTVRVVDDGNGVRACPVLIAASAQGVQS